MLKTIIFCLSDVLYDHNGGMEFYRRICAESERMREICRPIVKQLRISKETWNRTVIEEIDKETIRLAETEKAQILFLTDIPYFYHRVEPYHLAVLPIALTYEHLDAFPNARYLLAGLEDVDLSYLNHVYERYHHIPWRIFETERTIVREMTEEDVEALYQIYADPKNTRYIEPLLDDPEEERAYIRQYIDSVYHLLEFGLWIVEDREKAGTIIGRIGLSLREGFDDPELGYIVRTEFQKKGYATEVCRKIISYAQREFSYKTLRILMDKDNEASHKLAAKLGFSYDKMVEVDQKQWQQYVLPLKKEDGE